MTSARDRWLLVTLASTIFMGAFLLFQIQPLISKQILPWFGGSAAVWTTCMLFFQSLLFAGYAYAHWSATRLRPRQQFGVHAAIIVAALLLLGVLPAARWEPAGNEEPVPAILAILAVSVGLPYFVLSATAPLLQAWFARSFPGRTPYRLYALSNVGALLALISYPLWVEPALELTTQARIWSCLFVAFAALCLFTAWRTRCPAAVPTLDEPAADNQPKYGANKQRGSRRAIPVERPAAVTGPSAWQWITWLLLPAFGSIVLLAITNHVTYDIAAMPLLWVVPLALYLLTFIIAFDRPAWYLRMPIAVLALASIYATALVHHFGVGEADLDMAGTPGMVYSYFHDWSLDSAKFDITTLHFLAANSAAMFAICMLCHGELARSRPAVRHLTAFYLMIALGGALGAAFVTLIAPRAFETFFEWELSLIVGLVLAIVVSLRACVDLVAGDRRHERQAYRYAVLGAIVFALLMSSAVVLLDLEDFLLTDEDGVLWRSRNFFGTLTVKEADPDEEPLHWHGLLSGTITHGAQFTEESLRREPTTYYARDSGVGRAIAWFQKNLPASKYRLGAVGLGTGTLAAYMNAGESITFYEINPAVIELAERGPWFTFLRDCRQRGAGCDVRLGDARLTLRRETNAEQPPKYHLLALDAFSGDSIPIHLLTTEAFEIYLAALAKSTNGDDADEDGAIAVHVSNRYVDLVPVVRAVAARYGLEAVRIENDDDEENRIYSSDWIILTRNRALAEELKQYATSMETTVPDVLWTDTRSSLFEVLQE